MMQEVREQVEYILDNSYWGQTSARERVEIELWKLVELAMKVQKQINGGHK